MWEANQEVCHSQVTDGKNMQMESLENIEYRCGDSDKANREWDHLVIHSKRGCESIYTCQTCSNVTLYPSMNTKEAAANYKS